MDLKKKFKTFIAQQNLKSPQEENSRAQFNDQNVTIKEKIITEAELITQDPQVEAEILASIERNYYSNENFDSGLHELKKFKEGPCDNGYIKAQKHLLWRQLQVVSKKVSDLILQNQSGYTLELQRVTDLQTNLQQALVICGTSRNRLKQAKEEFTVASLGILAKYRKRQHLSALLQSLHTIKTLQQTDLRLRELMEEENYPGAIQLCLACQKAAADFRHYKCISELSSKLQDTLVMIEEQLDVALSSVCGNFKKDHYHKLQTAYRLLGKTQIAMDQLHMHFTSAIHNKAFTVVLKNVESIPSNGGANLPKRQYSDLCCLMNSDNFTNCLMELCKVMWEIMRSYYCIIQWHEKDEEDCDIEPNVEVSLNRQYIKQKLEHGLLRIWQDIQHKVKLYIQSVDLSSFKFDEFILVLDLINRLMLIGEEFCGSKSEALQDCVRKQSMNYFKNYHRARIDELKLFLESEGWEPCPVKSNFSILKLTEFRFMTSDTFHNNSFSESMCENDQERESFFRKYLNDGNPFVVKNVEQEVEDFYEDYKTSNDAEIASESDDSDIDDELKKDYVDEKTGEIPSRRFNVKKDNKHNQSCSLVKSMAPILSNTILNVLRLVGKYMQMMSLLSPIAFDVVICMSQLFDYCLYNVYQFFVKESDTMSVHVNPIILRSTIKRIHDNLILNESDLLSGNSSNEFQRDKIPAASLSPLVNVHTSKLFGLAERVIAVESMIYLADQFIFLQKHIELALPANKKLFIQQFFSQTIASTIELRKPVYLPVPWQSINFNYVLGLMSDVQWDIRDIMSQHSSYVDILLQEMKKFGDNLIELSKDTPIPKESYDVLWNHAIRMANFMFVEGFCCVKKCTNEGRALMQLDFQHFLMKLDKLTELHPIPWKEHVEAYVKAFYLPETVLEGWIKEHQEYSSKQLTSLVNCMSITRRGRTKLINTIEENEKLKV